MAHVHVTREASRFWLWVRFHRGRIPVSGARHYLNSILAE
jgi:hypothetical protein